MVFVFAISVYLAYLLGLGLLIAQILPYKRNSFFVAYGVGLSVLVLTQVPFRLLGGDLVYWYLLVHGTFGALILVALGIRGTNGVTTYRKVRPVRHSAVVGALAVTIIFSAYHFAVGPYTEIPSDFWARLGDVKNQLMLVQSGTFSATDGISRLVDDTVYVPFLHAAVANNLGTLPLWLVPPVTWVTSLLFLLGIYWFTLRLVARIRIKKSRKIVIAMLASGLTLLTFGVATFSYVRYYAYFPHVLNATLMLSALVLFLDYQERVNTRAPVLLLVGIFVLVMGLVNQQEALFAVILMVAISLWRMVSAFRNNGCVPLLLNRRVKFMGVAAGWVTFSGIGIVFVMRSPGVWGQPHLIDMGSLIPFLQGLPIANPSLRFLDTLGLFGVVTYVWYFFRREWFHGNDYINSAMASPLFTLFNPLFVLWFISVASWDPLWRFSFLMPLSVTAAFLIGLSLPGRNIQQRRKKRYVDYVMILAVIVAMFPFNTPYFSNEKARLPSLMPVDGRNGAGLWEDLVRYLDKIPGQTDILTDYVTNYVLTTALRHGGIAGPKEAWQKGVNIFDGDYQDKLLYWGADEKLLIINLRDGELSENGRLSGHWPQDTLKISQLYPSNIRSFLDSRPVDFDLMWEKDKIWVYKILRDPAHYCGCPDDV